MFYSFPEDRGDGLCLRLAVDEKTIRSAHFGSAWTFLYCLCRGPLDEGRCKL